MSEEIINTKVCIVGAGPAGATTSLTLCKLGIPHVLVDAAIFPRDKVCGDGLDLKAVRVLNNIDAGIVANEFVNNAAITPSMGMRFILKGGKNIDLLCNAESAHPYNKPIFYLSRRTYFDKFLLDKVNPKIADVRLGVRITGIEKTNDGWLLRAKGLTINTRMLVGADGDHSTVLKYVGERKVNRKHYAPALRQYWKGVDGIHPQKLIELYFPPKLPYSYFWIFPLAGDEANVGFGMAGHYVARKKINIREAMDELLKTDSYLQNRFKNARALETTKGWGIPMATLGRLSHGDGSLLVGDAASIVAPNSGEGIGTGMISGYMAAYFIQRAIAKNNFSAGMFATYDREIHKALAQEEKLYKIANALPPFIFSAGMNLILSSRRFQKWFASKEMRRWLVTAYEKPITIHFE